jgi:hypothetical protein
MPDQTPAPSPSPAGPTQPQQSSPQQGPTINIGDEFGTAKRNLPPVRILLIALGGVIVIAGIVSFLQRAKPQGSASLVNVVAEQIPNQNAVLVALTFALRNAGEKSIWVHTLQGKLVTAAGEFTSEAVSAIDFDRYFTAFPKLKNGAQPPLSPEDKLQPGQQIERTIIVSFPVNLDAFNQHRSVSVIVQPYDQPLPIVGTQ